MKLTPTQPQQEQTFDLWAREQFVDINNNINPCDETGSLDPQRLNEVLTKFAGHFAWAVTMQEVESNKLNIANHKYDRWYKAQYNQAFTLISSEQQGGRAPGQTTIEARMVDLCGEEMEQRRLSLESMKSRVNLLKNFVRVLDKQASILQTLSSNMRSELFFAGGVSVKENSTGRRMTDSQKTNAAKDILRRSMRNQSE